MTFIMLVFIALAGDALLAAALLTLVVQRIVYRALDRKLQIVREAHERKIAEIEAAGRTMRAAAAKAEAEAKAKSVSQLVTTVTMPAPDPDAFNQDADGDVVFQTGFAKPVSPLSDDEAFLDELLRSDLSPDAKRYLSWLKADEQQEWAR